MKVKQIFNRLDIRAFAVCAIMIFLFIVGCVSFAFASDEKDMAYYQSTCPGNYYLIVKSDHANGTKNCIGGVALKFDEAPKRVCAKLVANGTMSSGCSIYSDVKWTNAYSIANSWYQTMGSPNDNDSGYYYTGGASAIKNIHEYSSNVVVFETDEDCINYIKTGVINNAIYTPEQKYNYSADVEIPLMAQCQVNGSDFLFNCMQSETHSDYRLQISTSVTLQPVYSNLMSKEYMDTSQKYTSDKSVLGLYDNSDIRFNHSFTSDNLLNGLKTDRESLGFKQFYGGKNIMLPYNKPVISKVVFYARNVVGNSCSNWVKVTYDLYEETSTYEEIKSVDGSNIPSDTKVDDSESYPDDYVYNDTDGKYSSDDAIGNIKALKDNYSNLVKFFKEIFGFLPAEIWIILISMVATMVIIALIKFIRG